MPRREDPTTQSITSRISDSSTKSRSWRPGINGKMSEFNAALGLLQLEGIDKALAKRAAVDRRYRAGIAGLTGIRCLKPPGEARSNYAYFPILVEPDYAMTRDELYQKFRDHNIFRAPLFSIR